MRSYPHTIFDNPSNPLIRKGISPHLSRQSVSRATPTRNLPDGAGLRRLAVAAERRVLAADGRRNDLCKNADANCNFAMENPLSAALSLANTSLPPAGRRGSSPVSSPPARALTRPPERCRDVPPCGGPSDQPPPALAVTASILQTAAGFIRTHRMPRRRTPAMVDTPVRPEHPAFIRPARASVPEFPPPPPPPSRLRRIYERFVRWGQIGAPTSPKEALRNAALSIRGGVPPSI